MAHVYFLINFFNKLKQLDFLISIHEHLYFHDFFDNILDI